MSGRPPAEIWEEGLDEGERRLNRKLPALAATGLSGGVDLFFGIVALAVTTGALLPVMPEETAHIVASLTFGLGFVFITIGRAELFTENFLIPVGAVYSGRAPLTSLLRLWGVTLTMNFVGLLMFAMVFSVAGVLEPSALAAAGTMADTLGDRSSLAAFMSAIAAGTIMTLFTWVVQASDGSIARIVASLIVGFILAAPTLNHAVVSFGELSFGIIAGTAHVGWGDLVRDISIALVGNTFGGVGLVFFTRLAQVRGEPDSASGRAKRG